MTSLKILVVDDQILCRLTIEAMITKLGHQVIAAESVQAAIEILNREKIDFIISDFFLPEMSGLDFFHQIKKKWPLLANKFVFLTGGSSMSDQEIPMFSKPVSLSTAREILKIALT